MEGYEEGTGRCGWGGGGERVVEREKGDGESAGLGWLGCGGGRLAGFKEVEGGRGQV